MLSNIVNFLMKIRRNKQGVPLGMQIGFRKKSRSCIDPLFSMKLLTEERREINLETHLAFLDRVKTLTVKRKILEILQNKYSQIIIIKKYNRNLLCKQNKSTDK